MKKNLIKVIEGSLLTIGLIGSILTSADAVDLSKKFGIGLGYPYFSVKYGLSRMVTLEARGASGSGIKVFSGRGYHNFYQDNKLLGFWGAEVGTISFDTEETSGDGSLGMLFLGGEYFVNPNLSCQADIGPAYIDVNAKEIGEKFTADGIEWIFNLGINLYFGHSSTGKKDVSSTKSVKRGSSINTTEENALSQNPEPKREILIENTDEEIKILEQEIFGKEKKISPEEKKALMGKHFNRATQLYSQEKYEEAIAEWEKVLELEPNHKLSGIKIEKTKEKLRDVE